jgi:calcineurin-like phosphoesterase family protein
MSRVFFTSDTHFGHTNIIKYSKRPFATIEEMDSELVRRWNEMVKPDDLVYHLGDFAVGENCPPAEHYLDQLNGKIVLIVGNHETRALRCPNRFKMISGLMEVSVVIDGTVPFKGTMVPKKVKQSITLCHYAMKVWNKSHHGAWQLYGHSHGSLPDPQDALQFDVGVDCWDFRPVTVEQIQAKMLTKTWKPVDHHNADTSGPRGRTVLTT